jgi:hypothetical protein
MAETRLQALLTKLERGQRKTLETLGRLTPAQWEQPVYTEPSPWTPRNLAAHFLSAEIQLLRLCENVAGGGPGAPPEFDYDAFNAEEQVRYQTLLPAELLAQLDAARQRTLAWARTIGEAQLDLVGRHPALGEVSLEVMILAIYGHQLLHMRELQSKLTT